MYKVVQGQTLLRPPESLCFYLMLSFDQKMIRQVTPVYARRPGYSEAGKSFE
jgi:hypothetical protein